MNNEPGNHSLPSTILNVTAQLNMSSLRLDESMEYGVRMDDGIRGSNQLSCSSLPLDIIPKTLLTVSSSTSIHNTYIYSLAQSLSDLETRHFGYIFRDSKDEFLLAEKQYTEFPYTTRAVEATLPLQSAGGPTNESLTNILWQIQTRSLSSKKWSAIALLAAAQYSFCFPSTRMSFSGTDANCLCDVFYSSKVPAQSTTANILIEKLAIYPKYLEMVRLITAYREAMSSIADHLFLPPERVGRDGPLFEAFVFKDNVFELILSQSMLDPIPTTGTDLASDSEMPLQSDCAHSILLHVSGHPIFMKGLLEFLESQASAEKSRAAQNSKLPPNTHITRPMTQADNFRSLYAIVIAGERKCIPWAQLVSAFERQQLNPGSRRPTDTVPVPESFITRNPFIQRYVLGFLMYSLSLLSLERPDECELPVIISSLYFSNSTFLKTGYVSCSIAGGAKAASSSDNPHDSDNALQASICGTRLDPEIAKALVRGTSLRPKKEPLGSSSIYIHGVFLQLHIKYLTDFLENVTAAHHKHTITSCERTLVPHIKFQKTAHKSKVSTHIERNSSASFQSLVFDSSSFVSTPSPAKVFKYVDSDATVTFTIALSGSLLSQHANANLSLYDSLSARATENAQNCSIDNSHCCQAPLHWHRLLSSHDVTLPFMALFTITYSEHSDQPSSRKTPSFRCLFTVARHFATNQAPLLQVGK